MSTPIKYLLFFGLLGAQSVVAQDKQNHFGKAAMSGEQVYQKVCITCHGHGLAGAPQAGKKKSWGPLISEGYDDLVGSALTGIRMMPPKGGSPELYDIEVARAINYMVGMAGGSFPEPTETNVKTARLVGEKKHNERLKKAAAARNMQQ